eukprot:3086375-Rhodomonas_salina.1
MEPCRARAGPQLEKVEGAGVPVTWRRPRRRPGVPLRAEEPPGVVPAPLPLPNSHNVTWANSGSSVCGIAT